MWRGGERRAPDEVQQGNRAEQRKEVEDIIREEKREKRRWVDGWGAWADVAAASSRTV